VNPSTHPQISFMIENGRLVRIDVDHRGIPTSEGLQVGDSEVKARKVYGSRMSVTGHISYTKLRDQIDNSPYDLGVPPENQLYVGWTEPEEWFNITMRVDHAGPMRSIFSTPQIEAEPSRWM